MPDVKNVSLGGGQTAMLTKTTTLTPAQIQALATTGIVIIPAPGAGKIQTIFGVLLDYHFGTRAYLGASADQLVANYNGGSFDAVTDTINAVLSGTQSNVAFLPPIKMGPALILPGDDNQDMVLFNNNAIAQGPIATTTLGAGGAGYVANDTGTITTGSGDATYKVLTVGGGGAVLTYQITSPGTQYAVGNGQATAVGGAQPGVGVGFTVNVTAVSTGDGTLKVVAYYQINSVT